MIWMSISLEHHLLLVMHPGFFGHVDRCNVLWVDQGDQAGQAENAEGVLPDGQYCLGGKSLTPKRPRQTIASLNFGLSCQVRKMEQATVANDRTAGSFHNRAGAKTQPLIGFQAALDPITDPFLESVHLVRSA